MKILDTTFLIDLLRGKRETLVIASSKEPLLTTQINMYEVMRGLFLKKITSQKFLDVIEVFENIKVLSLDDNAVMKSAEISSGLIKKGMYVSDCDCLTAGIALSKGVHTIVTKNVKHFERMEGVKAETY